MYVDYSGAKEQTGKEINKRKCAISSGHCLKLTIIFKSIKITNILQEKISTIDQIPESPPPLTDSPYLAIAPMKESRP